MLVQQHWCLLERKKHFAWSVTGVFIYRNFCSRIVVLQQSLLVNMWKVITVNLLMWSHSYGDLWKLDEWNTCSELFYKEQRSSCEWPCEGHFLFLFCVSLPLFEKIPIPPRLLLGLEKLQAVSDWVQWRPSDRTSLTGKLAFTQLCDNWDETEGGHWNS